jgi:integrase
LKWEDIDLGRKQIRIRNQEEHQVKEGKEKTLFMPEYLYLYLSEQRSRFPREIWLLDNEHGRLFYQNTHALTVAFRRHFQQIGIKGRKIKPIHGFRALFVDKLFNDLDIGLDVVQGMLGHSDIRVTQSYLPRTDKRHKKAVQVLDTLDHNLLKT